MILAFWELSITPIVDCVLLPLYYPALVGGLTTDPRTFLGRVHTRRVGRMDCFMVSYLYYTRTFWYYFRVPTYLKDTYSYVHQFFLFWFTILLSITPLLFTHGSKPTCFTNPTLPEWTRTAPDCLHELLLGPFFWATRFLFLVFLIFCFCAVR